MILFEFKKDVVGCSTSSFMQAYITNLHVKFFIDIPEYGGVFFQNGSLEGRGVDFDGSSEWHYNLHSPDKQKVGSSCLTLAMKR